MEKISARRLVENAGGYKRHNENTKAWLYRIAKDIGVKVRRISAAYYNESLSKDTEHRLLEAAKNRAHEDDSELILRIHAYIRYLSSVDAEMYRADINVAREFLAQYEDHARQRRLSDVPLWVLDDC